MNNKKYNKICIKIYNLEELKIVKDVALLFSYGLHYDMKSHDFISRYQYFILRESMCIIFYIKSKRIDCSFYNVNDKNSYNYLYKKEFNVYNIDEFKNILRNINRPDYRPKTLVYD